MNARCQDLDPFFDGELSKDEAGVFRAHLASCAACQRELCGRVQEEVVVQSDPGREQRPRAVAIDPSPPAARRSRAAALAGMLAAAFAIWLIARRGDEQAVTRDRKLAATSNDDEQSQIATHGHQFQSSRAFLGDSRNDLPEGEEAKHLNAAISRGKPMSRERPLELVSSIEHRDAGMRGATQQTTLTQEVGLQTMLAQAGDVLQLSIHGERHRALWIYRGPRELIVACPGDPRCVVGDSGLSLGLPLEAVGQYWVVALGSSKPILVPAARIEAVQSAATAAGARYVMRVVSVN